MLDREQWSGGPLTRSVRSSLGSVERRCRRSQRRAGRARRSPRSSTTSSAAAPCSALRTPSWRRRSRCQRRAPVSSSSTATGTTCACRFRTSSARCDEHRPAAAVLVHIGGHIAFDVEQIAALCRAEGHRPDRGLRTRPRRLLERQACRARGATPASGRSRRRRRSPPAKAACSSTPHAELVEFARSFREYGKPDYTQPGLNYRMHEFTAALGVVAVERLDEITAWKNRAAREELDARHPNRVELPDGMVSGLYKYIVFDPIERSTGQGLRRAVPPSHGSQGRSPEHRLGRAEPLVRAALLPAGERPAPSRRA